MVWDRIGGLSGKELGILEDYIPPGTGTIAVSFGYLKSDCQINPQQGRTTGMARYSGGYTNHFQILLNSSFQQNFEIVKIGSVVTKL